MKLQNLCERDCVRCDSTMTNERPDWGDDWRGYAWKVTLRRKGRQITVSFFTGDLAGEPTPADVLSCLVSDTAYAEYTEDEFLDELGYLSGSGKDALRGIRAFHAIQTQVPKVWRFLGDAFDEYQQAEH